MASRTRRRSVDDQPSGAYLLRLMGLKGGKKEPQKFRTVTQSYSFRPQDFLIALKYAKQDYDEAARALVYLSKPHLLQKTSWRWKPNATPNWDSNTGWLQVQGTLTMVESLRRHLAERRAATRKRRTQTSTTKKRRTSSTTRRTKRTTTAK